MQKCENWLVVLKLVTIKNIWVEMIVEESWNRIYKRYEDWISDGGDIDGGALCDGEVDT